MALHPQAKMICDAMAANPRPASDHTNLAEQRAGFGMLMMLAGEPVPVHSVADADADGVPVRIFRPSAATDLPVVVVFHGGGWTIGNVEQYEPVARLITNEADAIVVSVDYRLAPEYPFPAGLDDCWTALNWVMANAASFGGDATRMAVMGDSAGGNLAAVCALMARDAGGPNLDLQVLVYPVTDSDLTRGSYSENAEGFLLTAAEMRWFFEAYTRGGADPADWRIAPLRHPDLAEVAPALVITAGYDPLRDEGEAYAEALRSAGVPVEVHHFDDMVHGFFGLHGAFDASREAVAHVGTALRRAFGTLDD